MVNPTRHFTELPPLSLYVHIPWCVRKCPYCDFNSHEQRENTLPEQQYVTALLTDLEQEMPDIWGRQLSSIFIGGGTPSLFSAESLDQLLNGIRSLTAFNPEIEVTLEANPGTVEQAKFAEYRSTGINRLSIGIQSFNDDSLARLGRIHSGSEARAAIDIARGAGFDNLNIDLMFGLPQQSQEMAEQDLDTALASEPDHLSYYQLTIEPNTRFASHPPALPEHDHIWQTQNAALDRLKDANFQRYEVSAYARPGRESVHNLNYWLFGDYLGIGAGAHGKLSFANTGDIRRRWKQKHPKRYLDVANSAERIGGEHSVPIADTGIEFMMNALRLTDGFPMPLFQRYTGVDLFGYQSIIDQAVTDELLIRDGMQLRASTRGLDFLDDLLSRFMTSETTRTYPVINLHSE